LSEEIHNAEILKDSRGRVIVPYDLNPPEKRFWIRFLLAENKKVVILCPNGLFRDPEPDDIRTPSPFPPSSNEKKKRKKAKKSK
jgi:hypothetical protein